MSPSAFITVEEQAEQTARSPRGPIQKWDDHVWVCASLFLPLLPCSGVFPTVPPTRVGLRPGHPGRSNTIGELDCARGGWLLSAMPVDPLKATNGTRDRPRWVAHGCAGGGLQAMPCVSWTVIMREKGAPCVGCVPPGDALVGLYLASSAAHCAQTLLILSWEAA